jgi:hypothetical protein
LRPFGELGAFQVGCRVARKAVLLVVLRAGRERRGIVGERVRLGFSVMGDRPAARVAEQVVQHPAFVESRDVDDSTTGREESSEHTYDQRDDNSYEVLH